MLPKISDEARTLHEFHPPGRRLTMPIALRRELAIPLCAGAFCAVILSEPQRLMPFLTTLLAIAVVGSTLPAMVRRFRPQM
jgi:hypothetical protein